MANTYSDCYTLSQDAAFQQKVRQAILTAAIAVMAESDAAPDHAIRRALAAKVLANPSGYATLLAEGVATDDVVGATAPTGSGLTDVNINNAVSSIFTAYARS